MKVKVINKNLNDLQDNVFRPVGSVFECDKERAEYLLNNGAVEIVEEEKIEVEPKKTQFKKDMEFLANAEIDGVNCLEATCNAIQKASEKMKTTKKKKSSKK